MRIIEQKSQTELGYIYRYVVMLMRVTLCYCKIRKLIVAGEESLYQEKGVVEDAE